MQKGKYEELKVVRCIGIGGAGLFYIAKFLLLCGCKVYGHDITPNNRTDELIQMGAIITFTNPDKPFAINTDAYIYSVALPNEILQKIREENPKIKGLEVGELYDQLIKDYEAKKLTEKEIEAFKDSDIAPLYKIDYTKMKYIGITGTDGKTTTSTMIYHTLLKLGYKPGLISTVSAKIGDKEIDTGFHTTTPSSQELYKLIKIMEEEGCSHAIIESTSHGLAMGRLAGMKFDVVAYTNITNEHLDYHKTWENYALAKSRLISEHLKEGGKVIINLDDKKSYDFLSDVIINTNRKDIVKITYSRVSGTCDIDKIDYLALKNVDDLQDISLQITADYLSLASNSILSSNKSEITEINNTTLASDDINTSQNIETEGKIFPKTNISDEKDSLKHYINDGTISYTLVSKQSTIKNIDIKTDMIDSVINLLPIKINILGEYNISNSLAAIATTQQITNNAIAEIIQAISSFETIKGRMEIVQKEPYMVIVDFAHTPNALENALKSAKSLLGKDKKLISVFGCAGKRDPSKRKTMGEISGKIANITIITAEDPRTESLKAINDEIESGFLQAVAKSNNTNTKPQLIRFDDDTHDVKVRRDAIEKAIKLANKGDIIIICGKAHEQSLCFGLTEHTWNDIDEAKKLLKISK